LPALLGELGAVDFAARDEWLPVRIAEYAIVLHLQENPFWTLWRFCPDEALVLAKE
jgi:hypothetical protein